MKNKYFEKYDSIIKIKITGINIDNYIKRIIKRKINIIKLIPISHKEAHIILKYQEYKKITKYNTTYKISIIEEYGILKIIIDGFPQEIKNLMNNIFILMN